jgi:hypothetical protein
MRRSLFLFLLIMAVAVSWAGTASAATIEMTPNPASVNAILGSDFNLILDHGDSETNILQFTAEGAGGCGWGCGSVAIAAIVFDDVSVLSATDVDGGFLSAGNVVRGIVTPGGAVAGLLIDFGAPNSESFTLTLSATPTTATLYALNLDHLDDVQSKDDIHANIKDSTTLRFVTAGTSGGPGAAVPEPSAALVFAAGLLVVHSRLRRRSI